MVESYSTAYRILADDVPKGAISVERCLAVDNIFHRREMSPDRLLFHACLSLHRFSCLDPFCWVHDGRATHTKRGSCSVAPQLLDVSSGLSCVSGDVSSETFSPYVFAFYSVRPVRPIRWLWLV